MKRQIRYTLTKANEFIEYHRYLKKFELMQQWMINDLRNSSIHAHANLLVSLGIFSYIETLGSFCKLPDASGRSRFYYVLNNLMPKEYANTCKKVDRLTWKNCYDTLRCGMVHEYLVKTKPFKENGKNFTFTIVGSADEDDYTTAIAREVCGIKLIKGNSNTFKLAIINARFIHDLNLAFDEYKKRLHDDWRGYRKAFILRCWETSIHLLN